MEDGTGFKEDSALKYGCGDLIVIGRIHTLDYEPIEEPDGLLYWRNCWNLKVKIKRIVVGNERRTKVPAIGISHAQIRDDADYLAVLAPEDDGSYVLTAAALWDQEPRPMSASTCN